MFEDVMAALLLTRKSKKTTNGNTDVVVIKVFIFHDFQD